MYRIILGIAILLLTSCNTLKNDTPIIVKLNKNWQFKGIDTLDWNTATVPGNIFTDLLAHKIIKDPFVKNNEEKVQWVSAKNWEYTNTFTLSETVLKQENIQLNFDGIDTYATIYVNDSLVGKTENAFLKYTYQIKKIAKSTNHIRIVFTNANEVATHKEKNYWYNLPEGKRIYTRKAQFQDGWDWGPKLNTLGIWKPTYIKAWSHLKFESIHIKQQAIDSTKARLLAAINIHSNTPQEATLFTSINNDVLPSTISLKKGMHTYKIPIEIKNPKLWWTHNLGTPYQYQFKFKLITNGKINDEMTIKKGIRTIKLINKKDSLGESFYFELNGKPVYAKGANYIPQHSFQNKVTHQHYEKLLSDVVNSNMNMLRVWGGGIYENDVFYDLCDEKGILIWQDFMFACAMYPGNHEFLKNVTEEAEQQVKRLRNHTSIALWCGNNENSEGWKRWGWQLNRSDEEKEGIWKDYLAVFDSILPNTVATYSETDYWETSPKYGRGNAKYEFEGDAHDWWVWHDATPFEHFTERVPRFMSEFGFQAFPSYKTIKYLNQNDSIQLNTAAIQSHQKHGRGFELIRAYMERDYKIPTDDEDYVYVSQLVQAKGIVMGIEAHRRAKPYNMGTLYWQLNDCWPAISWSSIDYFGNWKGLQYKAKKAFENVLISSKLKKDTVQTFIINDNFKEIKGNLKLKIVDFYGKEIWKDSKEILVAKNSSGIYHTLPIGEFDIKNSVLISEFNHKTTYFYFVKPKDLNLPKGEIQQEITKTKTGFSISLKSTVLQKELFLFTDTKGHFSDNFFDLIPHKEKTIIFNTDQPTIDVLKIKTLNILN